MKEQQPLFNDIFTKLSMFKGSYILDQLINHSMGIQYKISTSMDNQKRQPETQQIFYSPKSGKATKKDKHFKKLQTLNILVPIENCKTFVLGISGGDCAGKNEMLQYMFDRSEDGWTMKDSHEPLAILKQQYFFVTEDGLKYSYKGTDWNSFYQCALNLMIGNQIKHSYIKNGETKTVCIKSAKLLVIEGLHIFLSAQNTHNLSSLINLRVFIDSDSDVRLSRRVYQDTQQHKKDLNWSVANYLDFIKPAYENEIEPTKRDSDILIPHFGGGFNDHKKANKTEYDSNIKNACNMIITHLIKQIEKYETQLQEEDLI